MVVSLAYAILALGIVGYLVLCRNDRLLVHPTMYALGTAIFMLPGGVSDTAPLWDVTDSSAWMALILILLSIAFVAIGFHLVRLPGFATGSSASDIALSPLLITMVLLVAVALKFTADPDTFLANALGVERRDDIFGKYLDTFGTLPTALACLTPWMWRRVPRATVYSRTLIVAVACVGLFTLSRTPVFYVLGTMTIFWLAGRLSTRPRYWKASIIVVGIAIVPALTLLAALIKGSNEVAEGLAQGWGLQFGAMYEFALQWWYEGAISDAYGNCLFILDNYPSMYAYMPGWSFVVLGTAWIPRDVIPWKPWGASYHVTSQILGYGTFEKAGTSLATSFVGELWMNGGWGAVVIGSLLLGFLGAVVARRYISAGDGTHQRVLYVMSLVMFVLIPRGDLVATGVRGAVYLVLALIAGRSIEFFSKRL